jgi:hypothetical protein
MDLVHLSCARSFTSVASLIGMTCSRDWLPQIFKSWMHGYHRISKKTRITNLIESLPVDLVHSISPEIAWDEMRDPCKFGMPQFGVSPVFRRIVLLTMKCFRFWPNTCC